jgi:hypothetical protein
MSKVKKTKVETHLSRVAFTPGGMTVADALKRVDASLETMRAPCDATIDESLTRIEIGYGAGAAGRETKSFDELYRLAAKIVDASIFASETDVDKAARALCQLTDLCRAQNAWDWVAVDLHIDTLRMLRTFGAALGAEERAAVIEGLKQVTRKRVGDPDALPA